MGASNRASNPLWLDRAPPTYDVAVKAAIVIPTVDRVDELYAAIGSAASQSANFDFEIVVVDNSTAGRQRAIVETVARRVSKQVRYVHQPRTGLAQARNAGVNSTRADFIAFLDDDEEPLAAGWLGEFVSALDESGADAAFGPVKPTFVDPPLRYAGYVGELYTRDLGLARCSDVASAAYLLGSGNSCFRAASCFPKDEVHFDTRFDATGGEDTDFIRRLTLAGKRLIWVPQAVVAERVTEDRVQTEYLKSRRFAQGQMRTAVHASDATRRVGLVGAWMALGVLQFSYETMAALVARVRGNSVRADIHEIEAYGGLGKILWHRRFRRRRYGAAGNPDVLTDELRQSPKS